MMSHKLIMYDESSLSLPVSLYVIIYGMGWLRLAGSFKLYVSFAEYRLFYRALLQNIVSFIGLFLSSTLIMYDISSAKILNQRRYHLRCSCTPSSFVWHVKLHSWMSTQLYIHFACEIYFYADYVLRAVSFHMCTYYVYFIYLYSYIFTYLI